jgi:hypothetical protein
MLLLLAPVCDGPPRNVRTFRAPIEDLIDTVTRGNPTEVKVILASVALALAVYQLVLISIVYGKLRLPFLSAPPASQAHRAVGDSIVVVRRWHAMSRFLPALGISVWLLLALTWLTSAGDFLSGS